MSDFLKKQSIACYTNGLAAILGVVALIAMLICNSISNAYAFTNVPLLMLAGIAGAALAIVTIYAANRWGNHDYVGSVSVVAAIVLFSYALGSTIGQRILLISGLFSYNSDNAVGWSVFYATVVFWVCLLLAILLLIVGSFMRLVKEK